jgi:AcrR family transcriptional regulator
MLIHQPLLSTSDRHDSRKWREKLSTAPSSPATASGGAVRSDAQRNRDRIIDAASAELEADPDVALRKIAKKAGVGQGTLYRNFPDREALLWAVHHREVERLGGAGDELLERLPPLPALREWMRRLGAFAIAHTTLGHAMHQSVGPAEVRPGHTLCADALSTLLAANKRAGTVRPDVTREDLLLALAGIWQVSDPEMSARAARAQRLIDIVIAGIAPDGVGLSRVGEVEKGCSR